MSTGSSPQNSSTRFRKRRMSEINVVPYIDVMLVLLVIFMVTAPMMQTGVEVDLPQSNAESIGVDNENEPVSVVVDNQGNFYLGDDQVGNETELAERISDQLGNKPDRPIHIRGDHGVEYNYIMRAMVAAQNAGAKNIGLITATLPATTEQ